MSKAYSLDLRERVWGAWQRGGGSQPQIAARFGVSVSFVRDLSRRWRESGAVAAKAHGGGRGDQGGGGHTQRRHHRGASSELGHAGSRLGALHPGPLAAQAAADAQKKTLGDDEHATERVQALRQAFQAQVARVAPEDLVFIDESGVNRAMTRTHARSPAGARAFGSAPRNWGDNVSTLGAISLRGT